MRPISLGELPEWSPWPARLLGLAEWEWSTRPPGAAYKEYEKAKYAGLLLYLTEQGKETTPTDLRLAEYGWPGITQICASCQERLYLMSLEEALQWQWSLFDAMPPFATVVELGCGYGYWLWRLKQRFPQKRYRGGDVSPNAVEIAGSLYGNDPDLEVLPFDFYDEHYQILDDLDAPITIVTHHAIEQLPDATAFLDGLAPYREKIKEVMHFEPLYELHNSGSLLGQMRKAYAEANGYNLNLYSSLLQRKDYAKANGYSLYSSPLQRSDSIRIVRTNLDVFGINPLNPSSILQWEFI